MLMMLLQRQNMTLERTTAHLRLKSIDLKDPFETRQCLLKIWDVVLDVIQDHILQVQEK